GAQARASDITDDLASAHPLARTYEHRALVGVQRCQPVAVVDDSGVAVPAEWSGGHDDAVACGTNRCARGRAEVDARVHADVAVDGVNPRPEPRRDRGPGHW